MQLAQLIEGLKIERVKGDLALSVAGLSDDSRQIQPGWLFIARPGLSADGRAYIQQALARGACAILTDTAADPVLPSADSITWLRAPRVDQALCGHLAERFYGYPSRQLKLLGVTGTKGKTTVAFLIQQMLQSLDFRCGLIGTVFVDDGAQRQPAQLTTPGAIEMSSLLAAMVANDCAFAVAEISSHALDQGRVAALHFELGLFTNLTGDHLDYHQTMDAYAQAKARLFQALSPGAWAVINVDDPYAGRMLQGCQARWLACTLAPGRLSFEAYPSLPQTVAQGEVLTVNAEGTRAVFRGPWGTLEARLNLIGRHNAMNALQALAGVWLLTAAPAPKLAQALERCSPPPGRLEPVQLTDSHASGTRLPTILVDYAHTHDALEKTLEALRPLTQGRLIVVFGCGGDRDRTKRPKMAAVACRLADQVVITSDNPRTEDPQAIIRDILAGVPPGHPPERVQVEPDRAAAIRLAIASAGPEDLVLIAGKGHETYQIVGREKRPFDDRLEARAALTDWLTRHLDSCPQSSQPIPEPAR